MIARMLATWALAAALPAAAWSARVVVSRAGTGSIPALGGAALSVPGLAPLQLSPGRDALPGPALPSGAGLLPTLARVLPPPGSAAVPSAEPAQAPPLAVLEQARLSGDRAGSAPDPEEGSHAGASVFDGKPAVPAVDAGRLALAAPAPLQGPSGPAAARGRADAVSWIGAAASSVDRADPFSFRKLLTDGLDAMAKGPRSAVLEGVMDGRRRGDVAAISQGQQRIKARLLTAARFAAAGLGLEPGSAISNGTTLDKLLGMLYSGGMEPTSSYPGMKGESPHWWGIEGVEGGAGYAAARAAKRGRPAVLLIIHNRSEPIAVVEGELLSRQPTVAGDFAAAVVSDGERTVVLDRSALRSLAAAAQRWKDHALDQAYRHGRMDAFNEWQAWGERLLPP